MNNSANKPATNWHSRTKNPVLNKAAATTTITSSYKWCVLKYSKYVRSVQ